MAFSVSPAAFGGQVTADSLYKDTYIGLKQGKNPVEVLRALIGSAHQNKIEVKDVLDSAVKKGYMSQDQLNLVLDVAAKNAHLANDKDLVAKVSSGRLSPTELASVANALQGQVKGAAYYCGYYGCYVNGTSVLIAVLVVVLLAIILTPVVVVYGY